MHFLTDMSNRVEHQKKPKRHLKKKHQLKKHPKSTKKKTPISEKVCGKLPQNPPPPSDPYNIDLIL